MVEKRNEHGTVGTPSESASGNGDVGLMGQLDDGTETQIASEQNGHRSGERLRPWCLEILLLLLVFFVYAGDAAPMVNEAHYLSKAKNFWNPDWCSRDMFVASEKVHTTFYALFGWPTRFLTLSQTAWIGRAVGWLLLAIGLQHLSWAIFGRRFLCLGIAVLWISGIEYGNLAGEWVVGGIEAKVPAYGLVLLALGNLVQRRWAWVWILSGAAAAFHVLTGGWTVVAAMVCWFVTERKRRDRVKLISPALFIGGALALFGLVPALAMSWGSDPEQTAMAARIYSYFRIKHHLLPSDFHASWYFRFGILVSAMLGGLVFYRQKDERVKILGWFCLATLAISAIGLVVGWLAPYAPTVAAKLLRYYWFRLADAMVPLMVSVLVCRMLVDQRQVLRRIGFTLLVLAVSLVGVSTVRSSRLGIPPSVSNDLLGVEAGATAEVQQQVYRDWLSVCRWAKQSTDSREVFLTPRNQQTFKWFSERAEVVNWKDVPQNPTDLIDWYERFREVYPDRIGNRRTANRVSIRYPTLLEFRRKYGVRYMIVDRRITGENLPLLRIYPSGTEQNRTYAVYELPYPANGQRTQGPANARASERKGQ